MILDLRMPPTYTGEGIQAAAEIRARDAGIGILVLSTFAEASYASQLMEVVGYGVGYLLKDNVTDAGHLISQLERIVAGETVLDATVVRRSWPVNAAPAGWTPSIHGSVRSWPGWRKAGPTSASPRTST